MKSFGGQSGLSGDMKIVAVSFSFLKDAAGDVLYLSFCQQIP